MRRQIDAGLQQIADWHMWFTEAHRQRLTDLNLPREQFDRELADALTIGTAVAERMRADYLLRTPKP